MLENIRLSFQGIWSHKMRSFLTMLGIIIGIGAMIAIVSTIQGTTSRSNRIFWGREITRWMSVCIRKDWVTKRNITGSRRGFR